MDASFLWTETVWRCLATGVLCRSIPWQRYTLTKKPTFVKENRLFTPFIAHQEHYLWRHKSYAFCTQDISPKTLLFIGVSSLF
jgi:hypothetical protein